MLPATGGKKSRPLPATRRGIAVRPDGHVLAQVLDHVELMAGAHHPGARGGEGESGLVTLDWLLVLAAIAGIAAVSVLGVHNATDDETRLPADPAARLTEAQVVATFVERDAFDLILAVGTTAYAGFDQEYEDRCEALETGYPDVVDDADWDFDGNWTADYLDGKDANGKDLPVGTRLSPVRCGLTPLDLSAGP